MMVMKGRLMSSASAVVLSVCAQVLSALPANASACGSAIGDCGGIQPVWHGYKETGWVYNSVSGKLDKYDAPKLCNGTPAYSCWWVMLARGDYYVQAGWDVSTDHEGLMRFCQERDPRYPLAEQTVEFFWEPDPGVGPVDCECTKSSFGKRTYWMKCGEGKMKLSRDFGDKCFVEAQFCGETSHSNAQMPGDRDMHVAFTDCRRMTTFDTQPKKPSLQSSPGGDAYGLSSVFDGDTFQIWDKRCPK